jgi:hypothetical protein
LSNARFLADIPTLAEAKGDILAATADNQWDVLSVGSNGEVLKANSSTPTGLEWSADAQGVSTGKAIAMAIVFG